MTNANRESRKHITDDPTPAGGDIAVDEYQASVVGDEAVGGTVGTPDQNIVDHLGAALGVEMNDYETLATTQKLTNRDQDRWELDPDSKESTTEV